MSCGGKVIKYRAVHQSPKGNHVMNCPHSHSICTAGPFNFLGTGDSQDVNDERFSNDKPLNVKERYLDFYLDIRNAWYWHKLNVTCYLPVHVWLLSRLYCMMTAICLKVIAFTFQEDYSLRNDGAFFICFSFCEINCNYGRQEEIWVRLKLISRQTAKARI